MMNAHPTMLRHDDRTCATTDPTNRKPFPALLFLKRVALATSLAMIAFGVQAGVVETNLFSFPPPANCMGGLVQGNDGNFYGTTEYGGTNAPTNGPSTNNFPIVGWSFHNTNGLGTIFKINTNGVLTHLYSFTGGTNGANPLAGLVLGSNGFFYGTTWGGLDDLGTVFKISTNGVLTTLHSFGGWFDGAFPMAGLVEGNDGFFYGTTSQGGTNDLGTVFKISTCGELTSLYSFTNGDGANPYAGLVQGSDGFFYGTTVDGGPNNSGTVFKISTNGPLTCLYAFTNADDGVNPKAALIQGSDGDLYGTTQDGGAGGTYGFGTVFKITTNGSLTTLYSFTGGNDGASPEGGLVQCSDGYFYGTTQDGGVTGSYGLGTVFRISTNGAMTHLYSFTGGQEGSYPNAGLVQGSDGKLYGTTAGANGLGGAATLFRLTIEPEVLAMTLSGNTLEFTWRTEPGGKYQLQYATDLDSGQWTNFKAALTADGTALSAIDYVTEGPQRFYRVTLAP